MEIKIQVLIHLFVIEKGPKGKKVNLYFYKKISLPFVPQIGTTLFLIGMHDFEKVTEIQYEESNTGDPRLCISLGNETGVIPHSTFYNKTNLKELTKNGWEFGG